MSKASKHVFFSYYWFLDEKEEDVTSIRIYGINDKEENICVRVDDFQPYVYIELPSDITWTAPRAQILGNKLDQLIPKNKAISKSFEMKYKLYGVQLNDNGDRKKFPYLKCTFSHKDDIKKLGYALKKSINVIGIGFITLKMHEQDADPILQFVSNLDISTAGWICFKGQEVEDGEKITLCHKEYIVKSRNICKYTKNTVGKVKIMGFDIEVNSTNPFAMPSPLKPGDKVFQISCVFTRDGSGIYDNYLLTLGEPDQNILGDDINIKMFDTEYELLEGFTELIREENPNIIVGYNILQFDIHYMIERAKREFCGIFYKMGFHKYNNSKEKTIKWSSSAYKNQEFQFLDAEGRIFVDLLPLIQRDYKFNNYQLKTVSINLLGDTKDDLSVKNIFKCYRIGTKKELDGTYSPKAKKAMGIVGRYCVKDSVLVVKLMEKMQTWVGLCEQASTYNTSIFSIYTQGQQIKVFSQVYKYCLYNDIVVEKDGYIAKEDERYVGAHVFPPVPGLYNRVLPFDFSSLYPTTIIAYNIDYSTIIFDDSIPDRLCNVMSWSDHVNCSHDPKVIRKNQLTKYIDKQQLKLKELREKRDKKINKLYRDEIVKEIDQIIEEMKPYREERAQLSKTISKNVMCAERYYRFLKEPKGVIPTILQNLLDARSNTRSEIKLHKKEMLEIKDKDKLNDLNLLNIVLDKRQLAYKISANSMYGAMGVKKGYLPFMPGAMCCTYMGRTNIEIVAKVIPEKYGGELVYGDTDSNYIHFPHLKTAHESWEHAEMVAEEVSKLFPKPISLAFEEAIYWQFFILTKKRYMYKSCGKNGVIQDKIGKKGVILARRDSAVLIRALYERVIEMIFDNIPRDDILYFIIEELNKICSNSFPHKDYVITKAVGDVNDMTIEPFIDEKGIKKARIGNYKVPILPITKSERDKQLLLKDAEDEAEYYKKCLPAVVQLAEKMRSRGQRVDAGTRLEYVIIDNGIKNDKQYNKLENLDYFNSHSDILKIDFMYYVKLLINPIDQLLNVAFDNEKNNKKYKYKYQKDFLLQQYDFRNKSRDKVIEEIKNLFKPKIEFQKK